MVRVGLVGAGHFARTHAHAIAQLGERVQLAAYARASEAPFPEAETLGAARMTPEALTAAPDLDAVVIAVPNHLHRRFAEAALHAGKHVFCEKPLALTPSDAHALAEASRQAGRVLMVGHLTRHMPLYREIAGLIGEGRLGDLVAASFHRMHSVRGRSWRMDPDMGGGAVFDLLIHDYDLMLWYMGRPSCVVARGIRNALGSYDYAAATFVLPGGALAVVEGGFVLRPPAGLTATLRLVGTRGHLEADAQAETPIRVFEEGKSPEFILPGEDSARVAGVASELLEFCEAVAGRPPDRLRLEDACQDVAVAAAVVRAANTGQDLAV